MSQFNSSLNVPIAENTAINGIKSSYNTDQSVVRLFLIPPRSIVNTYKRPHEYNFSYDFVNDVAETVYNSTHGNSNSNIHRAAYLTNSPSAATALLPSNNGYYIDNRPYSFNWTFILQMDNINNNNSTIYNGPRLNNRRIYCGVIFDEPCTENMGRIIENPNALLRILHYSQLNLHRTADATSTTTRMVMNSDVDFMPADLMQQLNNSLTEMLRPTDLAECSAPGVDGRVYVSNHNSLSLQPNTVVPINTAINSPKQHLHDIVISAMQSVEDATVNNSTSSILSPTSSIGLFGNSVGNIADGIINNLKTSVATDTIGLDGTKNYTIGDLRAKFPNLEIIPINMPTGTVDDLSDQSYITRANSASDIVVTSVPVLAVNCGLAEIAFRYSSYVPSDSISIGLAKKDGVIFDNFAPWCEEPGDVSNKRLLSFINHFREQVVPSLTALGGDFQVACSYTSSGLCDVLVMYNDEPNSTVGIYQSPLFLGGLNTPLVGSNKDKHHNSENLAGFNAGIETNIIAMLGRGSGNQFNGFNGDRTFEPWNEPSVTSGFAEGLFANNNF